VSDGTNPPVKAEARNLSFWYGPRQALKNVQLRFFDRQVTALIGPSGCGKSTLLRCFNRLHDLYPGNRYEGELLLYPHPAPSLPVGSPDDLANAQRQAVPPINIVGPNSDPVEMRMRIGMVFQKPNPFPKTIFENVAFSLRLRGLHRQSELHERVEQALREAALWEETRDRLHQPASSLSGGQQQRLCIARALVSEPQLLLLDEPTSSLDPVATARIEDLIYSLRSRLTILIVTHNMQQAARLSDWTAFLYQGELIEVGPTSVLFHNPSQPLTEQYLSGDFGA